MNEWDGKALIRADLATGVVVTALGLAVVILSARMPTFVERNVNPLTAPGIVPAVVGAVLLLCGAILTIRSLRRAGDATGGFSREGVGRIGGTLVLMLIAVALVGRIDFRIVSSGFTIAFAALFLDWRVTGEPLMRRLAAVGLVVLITGLAIPTLFESVFLVRLP
ncbi:MAG: tripartite tricarboxylate transporter TctB family protein [Bauldia sp.]|nr:tripartite tricarboxylate transporter TctB family protein [Bauldia sp.]